jgi:hypothetical protein
MFDAIQGKPPVLGECMPILISLEPNFIEETYPMPLQTLNFPERDD